MELPLALAIESRVKTVCTKLAIVKIFGCPVFQRRSQCTEIDICVYLLK